MPIICWHPETHKKNTANLHKTFGIKIILVNPKSINLHFHCQQKFLSIKCNREISSSDRKMAPQSSLFLVWSCSLWTTSELMIYMLSFIFTNVTQIFCCCPNAQRKDLCFFQFPTAENHHISLTHRWKISVQLCILPPPSLLSSPCSAPEYGPVS